MEDSKFNSLFLKIFVIVMVLVVLSLFILPSELSVKIKQPHRYTGNQDPILFSKFHTLWIFPAFYLLLFSARKGFELTEDKQKLSKDQVDLILIIAAIIFPLFNLVGLILFG